MSGCVHAIHGAGGYNPRSSLNVVVSHVVPVANPDKFLFIQLGSDPGTARKVEGFTVTDLLPLWAGQQFKFVAGSDADSDFDFMLTVSSGTAPTMAGGSAVGSWVNGGGFWGYERSTTGHESGSWIIQVRSAASGQVITSWGVSPDLLVTP